MLEQLTKSVVLMSELLVESRVKKVLSKDEIQDMKVNMRDRVSAATNTALMAASYVIGFPAVLAGTKTLTSVEVNAVAPIAAAGACNIGQAAMAPSSPKRACACVCVCEGGGGV